MDKATETARDNILASKKREEILKRVEEKEYVKRCLAVDVCPECGNAHENIGYEPWIDLACTNRSCGQFEIIKKSRDT